jgi:ferredoxin
VKDLVDEDRCEGHARCQTAAPSVFRLGEDDLSHVLLDDVPRELVPAVEHAIRICPRQAIALVEEA